MIKPRLSGGRRGFLQKSSALVAMSLPFGMKVSQHKSPKFKLGDKVKSHLECELPSGHYSVSLTGIIIGIQYHAPIDLLPDYSLEDIKPLGSPNNGYSYVVNFFSVIANGKVEDSYIGVFDDDKDVTFDSEGNIVLMDKRLSN